MVSGIALVCPERRLQVVLRLALEAAGWRVLDWPTLTQPAPCPPPAVVVIDLDSAALRPAAARARLARAGLAPATPLLLISVYPAEADGPLPAAPLAYLQPPFAPHDFVRQVERLVAATDGQRGEDDRCRDPV